MAQARRRPSSSTFRLNLLRHLRYGLRESGFLFFNGVALYLLIALAFTQTDGSAWSYHDGSSQSNHLAGIAGVWFADITRYFFGYLAFAFPVGVAFCGWQLFRDDGVKDLDAELVVLRSLGFVVTLGAGCGLMYLYLERSDASGGGVVGQIAAEHLLTAFGRLGGSMFLLALLVTGFNLATGLPLVWVLDWVGKGVQLCLDGLGWLFGRSWQSLAAWRSAIPLAAEKTAERPPRRRKSERLAPALQDEPGADEVAPGPLVKPPQIRTEPTLALDDILPEASLGPFSGPDDKYQLSIPGLDKAPPQRPSRGEQDNLPPLELLDVAATGDEGYDHEVLTEMSRQLETLLAHFGVEVRVVAVEPGPVITRFELEPAPGVKVSQISNLVKDLARGLSVISVRVVEVVPGKSVVGLEIPNQERSIVYLSEILDSAAYSRAVSPVTIALGVDISGKPVVADLSRMPHLLVAGTTGSGKSVGINAMLLSILYKARPEEVRLILVDPKMLELSVYEGIPHLLAPVVTDMKDAANALRWCVAEMERRYRLLAAVKVRNIAGYNRKVREALEAGTPLSDPLFRPDEHPELESAPLLEPLPMIVVVIDELADMMMIVGKKVEELIARLAQKARAAGIHLILATQRPSVDVITGLIKANIPTRIAFQVSSKVDSRTILDQMGAEQLLGHGDLLYLPPGSGLPLRVHGAFVDDHEVQQVVEYLKGSGEPDYLDEVLNETSDLGAGFELTSASADEADPLYDQAVRIVTETRRASISGVQRRLKIGYNRAARMMEDMEKAGIVGSLGSNGNREVLAPPPPEV